MLFKTLKKVVHAAKQLYESILAGADILDGLSDAFVTKAVPGQERCSLGGGLQFPRRSHSKGRGECEQDVDGWIEPVCQLSVCTLRFINGLELGSEKVENGGGRVTGRQLGG
ncbi:hypothetical protein H4582DRAFT_2066031 [Lactarius indigo]|nr:hypothetical protein H4582DRAFT_2066031 [Lactarius indigo]